MPARPRTLVSCLVAAALAALGLTAAGPGPGTATPDGGLGRLAATAAAPTSRTVLIVSVDGLNPHAIRVLGREGTPTLHRLVRHGAATLNARTEREQTTTLPNHTGMVTGRRVDAGHGGHGVTWNDARLEPPTVRQAAGHPVGSIFSVLESRDLGAALFAGKEKFSLFERSWPAGVDRFVLRASNAALVRIARADLRERRRALRFLHLSKPDLVGHRRGFMSAAYLDAVSDVDALLGRLVSTIRHDPDLAAGLTLVLTADHGGRGAGHGDPTLPADYRVPFVVWGAGVADGEDLYDLNRDYRDPGDRRSRYSWRRQPVRNGAAANLALDLLGLPAVRGSEHDADQDLDVR